MKPLLHNFKYAGTLKIATGKAICRMIFLLAIICSSLNAQSQNLPEVPVVYKNWLILGESNSHLDVSSRVVRCDAVNKVELKVISENNTNAVLHCTVTITNPKNGEKLTREINMAVTSFQTLAPSCGAGNPLPDLKIDLPESFDPMNIMTTIIF
jgi:hypothetical protein